MEKVIYLDNAATTRTAPEVVDAMLPYFTENYGNPSSIYGFASANKEVIAEQREKIADVLGAKANEIYFTAGGTESVSYTHLMEYFMLTRASCPCYSMKSYFNALKRNTLKRISIIERLSLIHIYQAASGHERKEKRLS